MKYIVLLILLAIPANAQAFLGGGFSFGSVVGNDDSGHDIRVGGFVDGNLTRTIGLRFDFNGLATLEYAPKAGTTSGLDLKARPEIRAFAPVGGPVKPFIGGGVQYNYFTSDEYNKHGLNVTATGGVEVLGASTLRVSRLFTDKTNNENRLRGWRYGYDLTKRFSGSKWAARFSLEYNRFHYAQPFGVTAGDYSGNSLAFRIGIVKAYSK